MYVRSLHFIVCFELQELLSIKTHFQYCNGRNENMLWVLVIFINSQIFGNTFDILFMNENSHIMTTIGTNFDQRISSYGFRGNYSFLDLGIQRSQYRRPKVTVHKCAETIQGRKLYEEIRYILFYAMRSESIWSCILGN